MNQEETFETLREILPELEAKLRQTIEEEYRQELQKAQFFYKKYADDLISKREQELLRQTQETETHLRRELSMLQRQRQQWLAQENNYRQTIMALSQQLSQRQQLSALTEITHQQPNEDEFSQEKPSAWKKKGQRKDTLQELNASVVSLENGWKNGKFATPAEKVREPREAKETKEAKQARQSREEQNLLQERPLRMSEMDSKQRTWQTVKRTQPDAEQMRDRGRRQDTMVLSPPRSEQASMRSSLLQPPNPNPPISNSKPTLFWNQEGKKKLLSMIRNIK